MADEANLPTKEEIAALPRWARVAFAARCARRVSPLFRHGWPDVPAHHRKAVVRSVEIAERSAATGTVEPGFMTGQAAESAEAAISRARSPRDATNAARAAASAADALHYTATSPDGVAFSAGYAAVYADAARDTTGPGIINDFRALVERSRSENWTDDTPVPPWVFGPMWPDGVPNGWPEADPDDRLVITVEAPPGATAEQIADLRTRLYESANQLVLAHGGPGLTLDLAKRLVTVNVLVPEGV